VLSLVDLTVPRPSVLMVRAGLLVGARTLDATETLINGSAEDDTVAPDGQVHDEERIDYLAGHLTAVAAWSASTTTP
jgi:hypothetical protein